MHVKERDSTELLQQIHYMGWLGFGYISLGPALLLNQWAHSRWITFVKAFKVCCIMGIKMVRLATTTTKWSNVMHFRLQSTVNICSFSAEPKLCERTFFCFLGSIRHYMLINGWCGHLSLVIINACLLFWVDYYLAF